VGEEKETVRETATNRDDTAAEPVAETGGKAGGAGSFGAELRRLRRLRGLSLSQLAELVHYSRGYLSRLENGRQAASREVARACDRVLGAGGALLAWVPDRRRRSTDRPTPHTTPRRGTAGEGTAGRAEACCPYPGPAAFGPGDADRFVGRERVVAELVSRLTDRLAGGGPLVLAAPSGAGLTSLLAAGLVPALARGVLPLPGADRPRVVMVTPTATPYRTLLDRLAEATGQSAFDPVRPPGGADAAAGARPRGGPVAVVIVDRFEEAFTRCRDEAERERFVRLLCDLSAGGDGEPPAALVVLGVRADHLERCRAHPGLAAALRDGRIDLGAMRPDELREAITRPAAAAGLEFEPGLVELLLRDIGASADGPDPGALPLLAHALLATWQQRSGRTLTVAGYQLAGGVHGAAVALAERAYTGLRPADRDRARRLLLRLVGVGEDDRPTRRRVARSRLLRHLPDAAAVLEALARARVVTLDEHHVELSHPALPERWPRLRGWIDADRPGLRLRQRITEAADAWEQDGRDPCHLYRGTPLATALEWAADPRHHGELSAVERAFLQASARDAGRDTPRRYGRLLRRLIAMVSLVLTAAITVSWAPAHLWSRPDARPRPTTPGGLSRAVPGTLPRKVRPDATPGRAGTAAPPVARPCAPTPGTRGRRPGGAMCPNRAGPAGNARTVTGWPPAGDRDGTTLPPPATAGTVPIIAPFGCVPAGAACPWRSPDGAGGHGAPARAVPGTRGLSGIAGNAATQAPSFGAGRDAPGPPWTVP